MKLYQILFKIQTCNIKTKYQQYNTKLQQSKVYLKNLLKIYFFSLFQQKLNFSIIQINPNQQHLQKGTVALDAQQSLQQSILAALAISQLLQTTLGPAGSDKVLQSIQTGQIQVTNDGATILKSIIIENPAARVLIDISRVQDAASGDGTTSVVVLAGLLLQAAQNLLENSNFQSVQIVDGFNKCLQVALKELKQGAKKVLQWNDLLRISRTTMSSKLLEEAKQHFSSMSVEAIKRLAFNNNYNLIKVLKIQGSSFINSKLIDGVCLTDTNTFNIEKVQGERTVLVVNFNFNVQKVQNAKISTNSPAEVEKISALDAQYINNLIQKVIDIHPDVLVNRQVLPYQAKNLLRQAGIFYFENLDFDDIERIAVCTQSKIISDLEEISKHLQNPEQILGKTKLETVFIGDKEVVVFRSLDSDYESNVYEPQELIAEQWRQYLPNEIQNTVKSTYNFNNLTKPRPTTIVLRSATPQLLDEAERSLHDSVALLSSIMNQTVNEQKQNGAYNPPLYVLGAGNTETRMSIAVEKAGQQISGVKKLIYQEFSNALLQIPAILSTNAGFDGREIALLLKEQIQQGNVNQGVECFEGGLQNCLENGVCESLQQKINMMVYATEAAEQIIRVDQIVQSVRKNDD